jgi:hypothetical protein
MLETAAQKGKFSDDSRKATFNPVHRIEMPKVPIYPEKTFVLLRAGVPERNTRSAIQCALEMIGSGKEN